MAAKLLDTQALAALPSLLQEHVHRQQTRFLETCSAPHNAELRARLREQPEFRAILSKTWAVSDFAFEHSRKCPADLLTVLSGAELNHEYDVAKYKTTLVRYFPDYAEQPEARLRQFRQQQMLRLIIRNANRLAPMSAITAEVTAMAEMCIDVAHDLAYQELCAKFGTPQNDHSEAMKMAIIGMGKLGAGELNLSSDVDLIFAFANSGQLQELSYQEFFVRLGRRIISLLDDKRAEGFVFRVDMRLRPYGTSGALALSFSAMEEYYQNQGRDWERYAMIRARTVAGDTQGGARLLHALQPFVFRRYIDFGAIGSLRKMKALILQEVQRKNLHNNIKIGAGGIRELEFVVQVFQLIRGGVDTSLRERSLLKVLPKLVKQGLVPESSAKELKEAYIFLRNAEHALQQLRDEQTQILPESDLDQARVASAVACDTAEDFLTVLAAHREKVRSIFNEVITDTEGEATSAYDPFWESLWDEYSSFGRVDQRMFTGAGTVQPESLASELPAEFFENLDRFANQPVMLNLQTVARDRCSSVMPAILQAVAAQADPTATLDGVLEVIGAILRRSAYLVLLAENPQAIVQLVALCSASQMIVRQLASHPMLLDELIDPQTLYQAPEREELHSSLRQQMLRIEVEDTESSMEQLRYFKLSHSLRVAAAETNGSLPLMKVSDYLSHIAEVILNYVLALAWEDISAKHGRLPGYDAAESAFGIIAYGKLGGRELGHGSDLDLVFIYDASSRLVSDGARPLDTASYFTRLGQRIIFYLNTRTPLGQLYEVDMRLRPSGNSGLLVSSVKAFVTYQENEAWTWEHQALVRARPVAGSAMLGQRFREVRGQILGRQRDSQSLRAEVNGMRQKMRGELLKNISLGEFHLKHSAGGIVDIEFMVQYWVLEHTAAIPAVSQYTDNIRILHALENAGVLSSEQAAALRSAYIAYRACLHERALREAKAVVAEEQFSEHAQAVRQIWCGLFDSTA